MHLLINKTKGITTEWQKLFPIVLACAPWYLHFYGKRLQFWCNNQRIVAIINSGYSKAPRVMDLVRFLALISMTHNFLVRARHVPGVNNEIADALSRFQVQQFRELAPGADQTPCTIPPSFMTLSKMKSLSMPTGPWCGTPIAHIPLGRSVLFSFVSCTD